MLEKLPELVRFTGDWNSYIETIYQIYLETIPSSNLRFKGLPVRPRFSPESYNKHYGFWHLTSDGKIEEDRVPNLRRCERIRWISWLVEHCFYYSEDICCWEENRDNKTECVIWYEAEQYVIILSERRDYWLLKTAYIVDKKYKLEQMKRDKQRFCATPKD